MELDEHHGQDEDGGDDVRLEDVPCRCCCSSETHVYLPYILSGYLQLSLNLLLIFFVGYVVFAFVDSVQTDVAVKVDEFSSVVMNEMALCSKHYRENRCEAPLPAMRTMCHTWETCMRRDPASVARTKLSAQTLGEIVNGFVEPLSYKTMVFFTVFLFGFWIASNVGLKLSRDRMVAYHDSNKYKALKRR